MNIHNQLRCRITASVLFLATLVLFPSYSVCAGELRNNDPKTYTYRIFWDDLSPTIEDEIKPQEEKKFDDKPCTIQLLNQLDNIFVRPHESIFIHDGILHAKEIK